MIERFSHSQNITLVCGYLARLYSSFINIIPLILILKTKFIALNELLVGITELVCLALGKFFFVFFGYCSFFIH